MTERVPSLNSTKAQAKNSEAALVKAQAVAGALFFVFLVLHLSNTLLAGFGAETYNSYQRAVRTIYQHPILELVLVVGPLIVHIISGLWLYLLRKKWQINQTLRYRVQTWAGLFLVLVVFGHMLATRGISFWYGAFPEFQGVAFSIWWIPGYFYPYYFLLFMAGLYHGSMGAATLLRRGGIIQSTSSKWLPFCVGTFGTAGVIAALLGFGGVLFEIDDPRDNDYARQYSEIFNIDLSRPLD